MTQNSFLEEKLADGIIDIDTDRGKEFGFTSDKFVPGISYLWKTGNRIIISSIESTQESKGYFTELVNNIIGKSYQVAVPTPLKKMDYIMRKWGWKQTFEYDKQMEAEVEIWINK